MIDTQARATLEEGRATVEGGEAAVAAVTAVGGGDGAVSWWSWLKRGRRPRSRSVEGTRRCGGFGGVAETGAIGGEVEAAEATVQMVGGEAEATVGSQDRAILGEGRATAEEGEAVVVEAVVGAEAVVTEIAEARVTGESQGRASMEEARAMVSGEGDF